MSKLALSVGSSACYASIAVDGTFTELEVEGEWPVSSLACFVQGANAADLLVGPDARAAAEHHPQLAVFALKRLWAQDYDAPHVRGLRRRLPFAFAPGRSGEVCVDAQGEIVSPVEITARIIKPIIERAIAEHDTNTVILSVPASFESSQRQAVFAAIESVGGHVERLVAEPVAAFLASDVADGVYAVCDHGGGVADVAIVRLTDGLVEVLGAAGDVGLGGDEIELLLFDRIADELRVEHGAELDGRQRWRLLKECRLAKHELSRQGRASIEISDLAEGADGQRFDVSRAVSRFELNKIIAPLLRRLELTCQDALATAGVAEADLDEVLLCGGVVNLPVIVERYGEIWARPVRVMKKPEHAVIRGLNMFANARAGHGEAIIVVDRSVATLGLSCHGIYSPLLPRNELLPARAVKLVATTAEDQGELAFSLLQGESNRADHNRLHGRYLVTDLPKGSRASVVVVIEVVMTESGLIEVQASDLVSGRLLPLLQLDAYF